MSDNFMIGPGLHENTAQETVEEHPDQAAVHAMLAIASAINRLADAVTNHTASQI